MERFFAKSGHLAQPLVLQWLMREVVQNGFRMHYHRVANKPWLHFKQVLFALQASLACDAECVCFERKTAEKRWKSMPFIYNKVLKRHEKAVAPSGGNSVTGMPGVKYFYRAAAWLVVYSPLSGLNVKKHCREVRTGGSCLFPWLYWGSLCCAAMAKKKVCTPCLPAWRH